MSCDLNESVDHVIVTHSCWLSSGNGQHAIWTFVAPMLAIILVREAAFQIYRLQLYYIDSPLDQCCVPGVSVNQFDQKSEEKARDSGRQEDRPGQVSFI